MDRLAICRKSLAINKNMLPIKFHFFLYALAISAVMSYFPIMVKDIGISATAVGIIYTVCPFVTVLANPIFGWITDKLHRVKLIVIVLIITQTPLFIGIVFVPPLSSKFYPFTVDLSCPSNSSYTLNSPKFLTFKPSNASLNCETSCEECLNLEFLYVPAEDVTLCGKDIKLESETLQNTSSTMLKVANISSKDTEVSPNCREDPKDKCKTTCLFTPAKEEKRYNEFTSYQFWTLLFLMVSSLVSANATIAIGDAACYEALEGKVNQFGKQRVWLTVGWGLGTFMTGYLLDLTNPNQGERVDFSYCAYVMLILIVFDIIALSRATLTKSAVSKHIFKDIGKIFFKAHPIFFAVATLLIGTLSGIQWNYQFWYLEELGASKLLLGLAVAVVCLGVEAPFMFISGWIVKRIGRDNSIVLAFIAFAIWFISISFIHNPWWIILIELSQGPSYGLFYVAMTSYGKISTAPGTEATMQTILGAIFHGLGIGSGSLLGGLGFDLYGGRLTYRFSGYFTVAIAIVYKLLTVFVAGENSAVYKGTMEMTEPVANDTDQKKPKQEIYSVT